MTTSMQPARPIRTARPARAAQAALAAALCLAPALAPAAFAAKDGKLKAKDMLLQRGWPEITAEEKALQEVEFAKGAPAVRILEYREHEWDGLRTLRTRWFHRTKILTEDGVEEHGNFTYILGSGVRIGKLEARTILPDGTVLDAKDGINQGVDDDGMRTVVIAFPQVRAGAILDLDAQFYADGIFGVEPWDLQETIPVLETRLVLQPPPGLRFRNAAMHMPPERAAPNFSFNVAGGLKAHAWYAQDVPPLPDLAYLPPLPDISQRLFVIVEQYKDEVVFVPIAKDWPSWNERVHGYWKDWFKKPHAQVEALAKQVAGDAADPTAKAEAIRAALRERFRVSVNDYYYPPDDLSPDEVLAEGSGNSSRLAGLAVLMLRAVGVEADLAAIRRRSDGILPIEFPMERMLNDMIVRYAGDRFFAPAAEIHASQLPFDCSGIVAMPIDGTADRPVPIPDFKAAENRVQRSFDGAISADGELTGTATMTFHSVAGAEWRRLLGARSGDERNELVRKRLRRHMPGLELTSLEVDGMEDATAELVIRAGVAVPGYASVAGKRLIFNPNLFSRMDPADWAPEERAIQVDLESAFENDDSVTIAMPEGVADIQVPNAVEYPAGVVGTYETGYGKRGNDLVAKRLMRLEMFRFPPQSYPELRRWFAGIAAVDEQPVVLTLP